MIILTSPDFNPGETIPVRHTCDGENVSPAFRWENLPEGTKELLLVCDDPDAPNGVFHHWAAWGIAPDSGYLRAGFGPETKEPGFSQAINDFGQPGYAGPCPPKGDAPHSYHFRLSALSDRITAAAPGATCTELIALAQPIVIEFTELVGIYGR
ncbi:YbhB/YbcL family Raf kinase inhibitor-like protein [Defluviimonas sp. WL0002]|uniref:YbhB/YbcL family Raf kinase inhibitor-like protein n=1 Tax=Albidovulum marisflavi TaxID=2984159 RepID=A0ABT2ZBF9_9RHOB|nr:YbhB/YbcL family Raf kinase inhibitor-like protein [Defluviimonas sp. WL0002]MCV2868434.1 YbhB/YbcL family Raf kinase inhibitor-like protein [Defluviimonas sp. WL0002]